MAERSRATIKEVFGGDPTDILHERLSDVALQPMRGA